MLEIIETLGVIAVAIVVVLIIVAIRLIGAIFEIRDTNNKIAEKLDEICKKLDETPKNYAVLSIRDELVDIAENIKKE